MKELGCNKGVAVKGTRKVLEILYIAAQNRQCTVHMDFAA